MKFFIRGANLKRRNINVLTKPCLYNTGIKLSKLLNTFLKVHYTNADLKMSLNVCVYIKTLPQRLCILNPKNS